MLFTHKPKPTIFFSVLAITFVCWCYIIKPASVSAQTTNTDLDISLSPPITYLSIKPGTVGKHTLLIKNDGISDISANLTLRDFKSDGHTGQPVLANDSDFPYLKIRDPKINWKSEFPLKAKSEKKLILDLVVPADATEGEYPLSILLSGSRIGANLAGQSQVTGAIGSNLVVVISSDDRDRGKLELSKLSLGSWMDSLQRLRFSLSFANQGQNATPIKGTITILNAFNKPIKTFVLYPDMVLAKSSRQARAFDTTALQTSDLETLLQQPDLLPSEFLTHQPLFLLGTYTILIDIPQGKQVRTIVALPISIMLVLLTIPLLFVTFKYFQKRVQQLQARS